MDRRFVRFLKQWLGAVNRLIAENRSRRGFGLGDRNAALKPADDDDPKAGRIEFTITGGPPFGPHTIDERKWKVEILEFAGCEIREVRIGDSNDYRGCVVEPDGTTNSS